MKKNETLLLNKIDIITEKRRIKNQTYTPPQNVYYSLILFREKVMQFMAEHEMLMKTTKKGAEGVGAN